MAHGSPRKEICTKCKLYGLTPRFNESKCPKCGCETIQITNDELRKKLGLLLGDYVPIGFGWTKLK